MVVGYHHHHGEVNLYQEWGMVGYLVGVVVRLEYPALGLELYMVKHQCVKEEA